MQRDDQVLTGSKAAVTRGVERVDPLAHAHERVDHRIPDIVDQPLLATLGEQVLPRLGRMYEELLRHGVCDDAVYLLGHRTVERAQPRLNVGHRQPELDGYQRGGE